jgi:hypothetical protein
MIPTIYTILTLESPTILSWKKFEFQNTLETVKQKNDLSFKERTDT